MAIESWYKKDKERRAQGQSVFNYCLKNNLRVNQWYYWQKKSKQKQNDFVELKVTPASPLLIKSPRGWSIELHRDCDIDFLKRLSDILL